MYKLYLHLCFFTLLFGNAFSQQTAKELSIKSDYLLYLPKGYSDDTTKRWPVVIFLHGSGERGNDVNKVKLHGIPQLIDQGKDFPFIAVSPQCPDGGNWETFILNKLLDNIIATYRVDKDRVCLTGLSMGGFGTWNWASHNPERFAAIAPVCGGGNPQEVWKIRNIPTWVFHGDKDNSVPIRFSIAMVDSLKSLGYNPRFNIYPGMGHNSWDSAYVNPELYTWMMAQKRNAKVGSAVAANKQDALQGKYVIGMDTLLISLDNNVLTGHIHNMVMELRSDIPNRYYFQDWWNNMVEFIYDKKNSVTGILVATGDEKLTGVKLK